MPRRDPFRDIVAVKLTVLLIFGAALLPACGETAGGNGGEAGKAVLPTRAGLLRRWAGAYELTVDDVLLEQARDLAHRQALSLRAAGILGSDEARIQYEQDAVERQRQMRWRLDLDASGRALSRYNLAGPEGFIGSWHVTGNQLVVFYEAMEWSPGEKLNSSSDPMTFVIQGDGFVLDPEGETPYRFRRVSK